MDLGVRLRVGLGRVPLRALGLDSRARLGVDPRPRLRACLGCVARGLPRIRLRGLGSHASVLLLVRWRGGVAVGRAAALLRVLRVAVRVHPSRPCAQAPRIPGSRGGASHPPPSARIAHTHTRSSRGTSGTSPLLRAGAHSPERRPADPGHASPASHCGGRVSCPPRNRRCHVCGATRKRRFTRVHRQPDRPSRVPGNAFGRVASQPTRRPPRVAPRAALRPTRPRLPLANPRFLDHTLATRRARIEPSRVGRKVREPLAGPLVPTVHAAHPPEHEHALPVATRDRTPFGNAIPRCVAAVVRQTFPSVRQPFLRQAIGTTFLRRPLGTTFLRRPLGTTFLRRPLARPNRNREQVRTEQRQRRKQRKRRPWPRQPKGRPTLIIRDTMRRNEHVQQP